MIVCHCHAVTDREIRAAARDCGARTCEDIKQVCSAGGDCGGCTSRVQMIVQGECGVRTEKTSRVIAS